MGLAIGSTAQPQQQQNAPVRKLGPFTEVGPGKVNVLEMATAAGLIGLAGAAIWFVNSKHMDAWNNAHEAGRVGLRLLDGVPAIGGLFLGIDSIGSLNTNPVGTALTGARSLVPGGFPR
jgi:hypothetical protein